MDVATFSKDPEVQVVISCDQPYFFAPNPTAQVVSLTKSGGYSYFTIDNDGTAPSGFTAGFSFTTSFTGTLEVKENSANGRFIKVEKNFNAGDMFIFDTRHGQRGVWRVLSGSSNKNNILTSLTPESTWLMLHSGENEFRVNTEGVSTSSFPPEYTAAYWGV